MPGQLGLDPELRAARRGVLRYSAALPCLAMIATGQLCQRDIITSLTGTFAVRTVTDSLRALEACGLVERIELGGAGRRVVYRPTEAGLRIVEGTVAEFVLPVTKSQ